MYVLVQERTEGMEGLAFGKCVAPRPWQPPQPAKTFQPRRAKRKITGGCSALLPPRTARRVPKHRRAVSHRERQVDLGSFCPGKTSLISDLPPVVVEPDKLRFQRDGELHMQRRSRTVFSSVCILCVSLIPEV